MQKNYLLRGPCYTTVSQNEIHKSETNFYKFPIITRFGDMQLTSLLASNIQTILAIPDAPLLK